jgi:hypothetical protein
MSTPIWIAFRILLLGQLTLPYLTHIYDWVFFYFYKSSLKLSLYRLVRFLIL